MNAVQQQLMHCISAYRFGDNIKTTTTDFSTSDWLELYKLASIHKLTAVVFDTMCEVPGFCGDNKALLAVWKRETLFQAANQASRSQRIIHISQRLKKHRIPHAIVKGVICRNLYSKPDVRVSGDEDIFIRLCDKNQCLLLLEQDELELVSEETNVTHWNDKRTGLHIELHTELFPSRRQEDVVLNQIFSEQLEHTVSISIGESEIETLHPTYHFIFLVCHALKHFVTGGFGVRMICDVITFAEQYYKDIDQQTVYAVLKKVNGKIFLDQLFGIGQHWLGFDAEKYGWIYSAEPDYMDLLKDCLDAGIYGQSTMSRRHSSGIVLSAAETGNQKNSALAVVFPSKEKLERKYPVLKDKPLLLPICWAHRLGKYAVELCYSKKGDNSPLKSVVLGKKRTEMMIKYGVLQKNKKKK